MTTGISIGDERLPVRIVRFTFASLASCHFPLALSLCAHAAFASDPTTHPSNDAPTWGLTWTAPRGCLQAPELAERVERRLRRSLFADKAERSLVGFLTAEDASWRIRITMVDTFGKILGTRELVEPGPVCRELDDRIVLLVTMLVQPPTTAAAPATQAAPAQPPSGRVVAPPVLLPPIFEVRGGERFYNQRPISREFFYLRTGHPDLVDALKTRRTLKTTAIVVGLTLAVAAVGLASLSFAGGGCTTWSGTPDNRGTCQSQTPTWWIASGVAASMSLLTLLWAVPFDPAPTSSEQDEDIARNSNQESNI